MPRVVKFAISIPEEDFKKLEVLRQKEELTRSKAVLQAVKLWEESKSMEEFIRKYEEGYKKFPEVMEERVAWEKASLTALAKEEW
ncbi:ribbon-helix-helix protein, CopG family [Patescibacteria group bacterium]|nr:ribbon-helix-helix protein, CopG family [Patescibacteria group bacterium]